MENAADEETGPEFPSSGPGSRRRRWAFLGLSALLATTVLVLFRGVLLPFVIAVVMAYVLMPVVRLLERRMRRGAAVALLYSALVAGIGVIAVVGVPRLAKEAERLAQELPSTLRTARDKWLPAVSARVDQAVKRYGMKPAEGAAADVPKPPEPALRIEPLPDGGYAVHLGSEGVRVQQESETRYRVLPDSGRAGEGRNAAQLLDEALRLLAESTQQHAFEAIRTLQTVIKAVVRGVFNIGIVLMLSAYLLLSSDRIVEFFRVLVRPSRRRNFDLLLRRVDRGLSGVIRGQLAIALVNGVLSGILFFGLGLRYWPILTVIATVLSIIPIFGAILSSIPAVLVALQDDVGTALLVLAGIVIIHQIEANFLNPKIMGDSAKVHPVMVVFALLGGEHVFGVMGALLAVPILSILQSAFLHFREVALGVATPKTLRESQLPPENPNITEVEP